MEPCSMFGFMNVVVCVQNHLEYARFVSVNKPELFVLFYDLSLLFLKLNFFL